MCWKILEFKKNNPRHLCLLRILLLEIFSEACYCSESDCLNSNYGITMFETWQKQSYLCNITFVRLKYSNFLSRRKRTGIAIEITQDCICVVANLKLSLLVHCKELPACKYFRDHNIKKKRKNIKEKGTL